MRVFVRRLTSENTGISAAGPFAWLRGPAITEIDSPYLRGGHRLIADPTGCSPRVLPVTSGHGNSVEIDVGMS